MVELTPIPPGQRLVGADRATVAAQFKEAYEKGTSIRQIAARTGRSYGFVHHTLSNAGVPLRGRGRFNRR